MRVTGNPGSPAAPRLRAASWLDKRLLLGVLLVLSSVLGGARVLAGADDAQHVWAAAHDLAAGTVISEGDLALARVRLFDASTHYLAGDKPLGYVVQRAVARDELLPAGSLSAPGPQLGRREITVSVLTGHLPPDLARGESVDVYVTPDDKGIERALAARRPGDALPRLVLPALTVAAVVQGDGFGATGSEQPVVLAVAPDQVLTLVRALSSGRIDLVRVPSGEQGTLTRAAP